MSYKLRSTLIGHETDVRGVTPDVFHEGGIITVSRDQSCRIWAPEENSNSFKEAHIFYGHTRYVAAVCTMPPSDTYPQGLVITGGHDSLILVFDINSLDPVYKLEGHADTVCSLDAGKFGTILSGSWDKTAKVWINGKAVINLTDHEAAIWSVKMMPDKGLMLTGSADKTIKLWKAGRCERTFTGHKDCVRCLAVLSTDEFLSSSNDGTIRRWLLSGECVQVYEGHTNYVYSIAAVPESDFFISSGEDRSIKIWKDGACTQTITLPCQSVWSVTVLQNGDIVAGGSDSVARVFTCNESRQAMPEEIKEFQDAVANQAIPAASNLDLGEIKLDQLPGTEALLRPGTRKDQTKLIKRDGIVEAHQWDDVNGEWQKVGEVTGAAGEEGSKRKSGKEVFEGKEYDYVFSVDIEEGKPPLKLPFNITDDPWVAAHKFIEKNDLSPLFLDQVANFVIKNTEGVTLGAAPSHYQDPFTGQGRYIPGTGSSTQTGDSDPFTGTTAQTFQQRDNLTPQYFPEKTYIKFTTAKHDQIISKLKECNAQLDQEIQLSSEQIQLLKDAISNLLKGATSLSDQIYDSATTSVEKFSKWPHEQLLPVLDITRILLLDEKLSNDFFSEMHADRFVDNLTGIARNIQPVAYSMLAFRIFTNAFSHIKAAAVTYRKRGQILDCCEKLYSSQNKNLHIALSSLIVNCSVYCRNSSNDFEDRIQLCTFINMFLNMQLEGESIFRLLVALGTLLSDNEDGINFAQSLEMSALLEKLMENADTDKVKDCASELLNLLKC